jgi:hypothetical protein
VCRWLQDGTYGCVVEGCDEVPAIPTQSRHRVGRPRARRLSRGMGGLDRRRCRRAGDRLFVLALAGLRRLASLGLSGSSLDAGC